jgi:hypothetical protein
MEIEFLGFRGSKWPNFIVCLGLCALKIINLSLIP